MSTPAYLIVESQITDPDAFKRYMAAAPEVVKAFAGEYLVRGGRMAVLEGDWQPPRLTVLRYPSFEAAQAMYDSPGYVAARAASGRHRLLQHGPRRRRGPARLT